MRKTKSAVELYKQQSRKMDKIEQDVTRNSSRAPETSR